MKAHARAVLLMIGLVAGAYACGDGSDDDGLMPGGGQAMNPATIPDAGTQPPVQVYDAGTTTTLPPNSSGGTIAGTTAGTLSGTTAGGSTAGATTAGTGFGGSS